MVHLIHLVRRNGKHNDKGKTRYNDIEDWNEDDQSQGVKVRQDIVRQTIGNHRRSL